MKYKLIPLIAALIITSSCAGATNIGIKLDEKLIENQGTDFSSSNILYVGGAGPGNYTYIQDAINDSNNDDTIFVYAGTYIENVLIDKRIKLIGENKDTTTIDGHGKVDTIKIIGDGVQISDFKITGGFGVEFEGAGILVKANNSNISNCIFTENYYAIEVRLGSFNNFQDLYLDVADGIYVMTSHDNIFQRITMYGIDSNTDGFFICGSNNNTICYSNFFGEEMFSIWFFGCDNNRFYNNNIVANDIFYETYGIELTNCSNNEIYNNNISNASRAIYLDGGGLNKIHHNNFTDIHRYPIKLISSCKNEIFNNFLDSSCTYGIDLFQKSNENDIYNNLFVSNQEIYIEDSESNKIHHNNFINNNYYSILLSASDKNEIFNNYIDTKGSIEGIEITNNSNDNDIHNNNILNSGIYIYKGKSNKIYNNNITDSTYGIDISENQFCKIYYNNIVNADTGIRLHQSKFTTIHHNNFINCTKMASYSQCKFNRWYKNYWNRPRLLPKLILGERGVLFDIIPAINFDWRPALKPNKI